MTCTLPEFVLRLLGTTLSATQNSALYIRALYERDRGKEFEREACAKIVETANVDMEWKYATKERDVSVVNVDSTRAAWAARIRERGVTMSRKAVKYVVLEEDTSTMLEEQVVELLKDGWTLQGGVCVVVWIGDDSVMCWRYAQALISSG